MKVSLTKLGHRKDPHFPEGASNVYTQDCFVGLEDAPPKVGHRYLMFPDEHREYRYVHTSIVKSVYVHESEDGYDKLVLPGGFPDILHIEIPELNKGDVLLATMNSLYLVRKIYDEA